MKKFLTPKRRKVLGFIGESPTGRTFGEIQRFIVEKLHGLNYDEMITKYAYTGIGGKWPVGLVRKYRGYWCTNLCGLSDMYGKPRMGLLERYCEKVGDKYFLKGW